MGAKRPTAAASAPAHPPTLDLDLDRAARCGFPEVVFGAGKTVDEVVSAAARLHAAHGQALVTRASDEALAALAAALPAGAVHRRSRCFSIGEPPARFGPVETDMALTQRTRVGGGRLRRRLLTCLTASRST